MLTLHAVPRGGWSLFVTDESPLFMVTFVGPPPLLPPASVVTAISVTDRKFLVCSQHFKYSINVYVETLWLPSLASIFRLHNFKPGLLAVSVSISPSWYSSIYNFGFPTKILKAGRWSGVLSAGSWTAGCCCTSSCSCTISGCWTWTSIKPASILNTDPASNSTTVHLFVRHYFITPNWCTQL